jgi:ABC-type transporter Mla MlaB component
MDRTEMNIYGQTMAVPSVATVIEDRSHRSKDSRRLAVSGLLAPRTAAAVADAITVAVRHGCGHVELDLSAVSVAETEDLVCLVDFHHLAQRGHAALTLVNVPRHVRELLARTLIPELIAIAEPAVPSQRSGTDRAATARAR